MDIATLILVVGGVVFLIGSVTIGLLWKKPKKDFISWMKRVEREMGCKATDIPDFDFRECWEFGDSPEMAAQEAMDFAEDIIP